nr:MAG TPA: hypothetical protein [Caudoviricetes sp.]
MFLALLLLTLTSGNDLAARRKAALKAIIVTGRRWYFTRLEWL